MRTCRALVSLPAAVADRPEEGTTVEQWFSVPPCYSSAPAQSASAGLQAQCSFTRSNR